MPRPKRTKKKVIEPEVIENKVAVVDPKIIIESNKRNKTGSTVRNRIFTSSHPWNKHPWSRMNEPKRRETGAAFYAFQTFLRMRPENRSSAFRPEEGEAEYRR